MSENADFFQRLFPADEPCPIRERLQEILERDPEFPSFPAAIAELQEKVNNPYTSFEEIAEIMRLDPGLSARLFSLVRSAAFAGLEINGIEEALFRLGLKETRTLILTTKFMDRFVHLDVEVDWHQFWVHNLLTARLTQGICEVFQPTTYKEYLAGLLHDTGKIVLAHYFPEEFKTIVSQARETGRSPREIEREIIGTDHAAIGSALCYKWGLDETVAQGVRYHHEPEQQFLSYCLSVANSLANRAAANIDQQEGFRPLLDNPEEKEQLPDRLNELPEWKNLSHFTPRREPTLSIREEYEKAVGTVHSMMGDYLQENQKASEARQAEVLE